MIAILLSTYNGESYIREQIESLFTQTNHDWQLFVRDDGSKDYTVDILNEYALKYPEKVHLLNDIKYNMGAGESFMHLLKTVNADYYMFCDQDDVWLPFKIEKTLLKVRELEKRYGKDKGIGVFTDLTVVDSSLKIIMPSLWKGDNRNPKFINNFYKQWTSRHATYGCTQMFNKATKKIVLPYRQFPNIQGAHDTWIEYILIKLGHYDYIDEQTILYRQHTTNVIGVHIGQSEKEEVKSVVKRPLLFWNKIAKDYNRTKLMPFYVSFSKVLWYRAYQSFIALLK